MFFGSGQRKVHVSIRGLLVSKRFCHQIIDKSLVVLENGNATRFGRLILQLVQSSECVSIWTILFVTFYIHDDCTKCFVSLTGT